MSKHEDQEEGIKTMLQKMLGDAGTDQDVMPEGYGEFGLEVTNPIPVHTIVGNQEYLEQLRTADGSPVTWERLGSTLSPNIPSAIDIYKIFHNGKNIATLFICPYNKKNSEKAPKGFRLASGSAPAPAKRAVPAGRPKPGAAPQVKPPPPPTPRAKAPQSPPKQKQSVRPKIWLFSRTGHPAWAVLKYFFWVLLLSFGAYELIELQWHMLSEPPASKFLARLPYFFGAISLFFITYGIVGASRVFGRFIFAEFLLFCANMTILLYIVWFRMTMEVVADTTFERVSYCVIALIILFYSRSRLSKFIEAGKEANVLNTLMKGLGGQPQIMFLDYLFRTAIVPLIAVSIVWSFRITLSPGWTAAFHIYGFLWACYIVRMMFKCLEVHVKSSPGVSRGIARLVMFLNMEIQFLILPAIGYFVMWYFGWLPMPAWVKWVYVIYGTIFLVGTYGFFINTKNERSL